MSLTSQIRYVQAKDSAATDGAGKTGIAFGSFTAKYNVMGGTLTALTTEDITTLGTYQAPTSAAHIRIKELNSADPTKGVYEVHFHNTQLVNTGKKLWLYLSASGAAIQPLEVDLLPYADLNATNADNLAAAAAAYTSTQGLAGSRLDATISSRASQASVDTVDDFLDTEVAAILAAVDTEVAAILVDTNELQTDWTNGGRLDVLIDSILADTNELQTDWVNGGRLDLLLDTVVAATAAAAIRTALGLASANLDTQLAALLALIDTEVAAILTAVDTEIAAILVDTGTDIPATLAALFTTALTESYNADGAAPTAAQALFVIMQMLTELSFSGTTGTVKKLDGSTTAFTLTINSATTPTSITRST